MRVVLDNNVFISWIFWKGTPHEIIKLAEKNEFEISTTTEILKELFGVLKRKKFKPLLKEGKTTLKEVFEKVLELVKIYIPKVKVNVIREDPPDNKFLACAVTCQASFVVSGDEHLLKLKEFKGIPIVRPREFLKIIKQKRK